MIGFAGDVDRVDIVVRLDLALTIDLMRVRVDEAKPVPDHSCSQSLVDSPQRAGPTSVSTAAARRTLAAAGERR
jgi:hypothetical protein